MKKISICLFILSGLWLTSCDRNSVKVGGRFVGNDDQTVYLEKVLPGNVSIVDSVKTDDKGAFKMKVSMSDNQPTIYNVVCNGQRVPLLLTPGENVKLNSIGNIARNYTVEGSAGSEQMRELKDIISLGSARLDSILRVYSSVDEDTRKDISASFINEYYQVKRDQIKFIVSNSGSLAGLYALYQRLPNDADLFNGVNDIIYYKLVADSTSKYYPESPYVKALQREIAAAESGRDMANFMTEQLAGESVDFPDIVMSDMYGKQHKLSSLKGKVILLEFWAAGMGNSPVMNAELKEIYEEMSPLGFEIYQVSLDENKAVWVNAVQEQKLPWISVCDFNGIDGIAPGVYNITKIPSSFLIDRQGNIVAKDLDMEDLSKKIKSLL